MTRFADRLCGFAVEVELEIQTPALLDDWFQISGLREYDQLTRLPRDNFSVYIFSDMFIFIAITNSSFRFLAVLAVHDRSKSWQSIVGGSWLCDGRSTASVVLNGEHRPHNAGNATVLMRSRYYLG